MTAQIRERLWREDLRKTEYQAIIAHFGWDAADQSVDGAWLTPREAGYRSPAVCPPGTSFGYGNRRTAARGRHDSARADAANASATAAAPMPMPAR